MYQNNKIQGKKKKKKKRNNEITGRKSAQYLISRRKNTQ